MASSSSSTDSYCHYDVFLSFRGEDTRYNFTSHLYDALCRNDIKAFIDYSIDRGDEITRSLERVIDGAKISVIVFSEKYADSTFCLDELVRIMECKKSKAQIVLPIFYKVDTLEETYDEAFARYKTTIKREKRRQGETIKQRVKKVERWKSAFLQSLELAGWHLVKDSDEVKIIGEIIKEVSEKLNNSLPKGEKLMSTSIVGQTAANNFEKIWKCLMNDEISRVGVYGMGGVGKTTIITHVNDELLARVNSFSLVCWVTVSKDLSIRNIQNNIAKMINLDLSTEDDERKRAAKLRNMLKCKKFVLILDDVWEAFQLDDVGIPPLAEGQKLLLTSRSRRVCEIMECKLVEVKPLSEQDALDLFVKESKRQINDSIEWRDIACSIVKECDGLPLAIVVIARKMIRVEEIWNWRNTLRELQKSCEGENVEMENKVFKVLKFSYDGLRNDKSRECFLYCSLFPEDHIFKRNDLIEYWIGMEIIDVLDRRQEELDKGNAILDELIHSSLLEKHSTSIKMHDVIRDMAHMVVKVGSQFQDQLESVQVLKFAMIKSFPNSAPHCSKLKTLVLRNYYSHELPGCFFANMQSLKILDMSGGIADSICNLRNLKMLIITKCTDVEFFPSIAGLEKLQYLKISRNEKLREIPKGIENLVNLKVLDLSQNRSLSGSLPSSVGEKLSHLRTLNLTSSGVEVEPETLIGLEKLEILMVDFHNLSKLNCYVESGHWRRLIDYRINYGNYYRISYRTYLPTDLKGMSFEAVRDFEEWTGKSGMLLPDEIRNLNLVGWESPMLNILKNSTFVNLQSIHINTYISRYLFTVDLAQHILHNVQELFIECSDELEEIIATEEKWVNQSNYPTIMLPKLKILNLIMLPSLRSIHRGKIVCLSLELISGDTFYNLERLPFCMEKEGSRQNTTIELPHVWMGDSAAGERWWNSLQWDDPNDKSMYHLTEMNPGHYFLAYLNYVRKLFQRKYQKPFGDIL